MTADSSNPTHDPKRRRFLTTTVAVVGGTGALLATIPFVRSLQPSARALAAGVPVDVDLRDLEPGRMIIKEWRGRPVAIVHRTEQMLSSLAELDDVVRDPNSDELSQQPEFAKNRWRSWRPEYFVVISQCTHLGCSPTYRPDVAAPDIDKNWLGGFYCACHGSAFDLAGRVYKGKPAQLNLQIPPYRFIDTHHLLIGEELT